MKGFTLIELLIILAILGILAAVVIPALVNLLQQGPAPIEGIDLLPFA